MPLGLKVMVLPRVAPGHGARTVPGGGAPQWASEDRRAGQRQQGPHRALPSSPGDVQENNALGFQVLNLGGQVSPVTLEAGTAEGVEGICTQVVSLPLGPPTLPASMAHSPPRGCAWPSPWSCPSGSRRRLSVGDRGRHHLVTGNCLHRCHAGVLRPGRHRWAGGTGGRTGGHGNGGA